MNDLGTFYIVSAILFLAIVILTQEKIVKQKGLVPIVDCHSHFVASQ